MEHKDNLTKEDPILNELLAKLISKYQPEQIICFGKHIENTRTDGTFRRKTEKTVYHYFLLMVIHYRANIVHGVQEYVDNNFVDGHVTVLIHTKETVAEALERGNEFFCKTIGEGELLYAQYGAETNTAITAAASTAYEKQLHAMNRFIHRYPMAEAFRDSGIECYNKGKYNAAMFLFHQAIEQSCKAVLNVYLDYRPDIHHLGRLIDLTFCFTDELVAVFPRQSEEDKQLFLTLMNSYTETRYNDLFEVSKQDTALVYNQVNEFLYVVKDLCLLKMPVLKEEEMIKQVGTKEMHA